MVPRETGPGAALLGAGIAVLHVTPAYLSTYLFGGAVAWLPRLETTQVTLVGYNMVLNAIGVVVGIVGVFALGYWAGTKSELTAEYRRLLASFGLGGALGFLSTMAVALTLSIDLPVVGESVGLTLGWILGSTLRVGLQFAAIGFAGAALVHVTGESLDGALSSG